MQYYVYVRNWQKISFNADKVGFINTHGLSKWFTAPAYPYIYTTLKPKTPKYTKIAIRDAKFIIFLVPDLTNSSF